MATGITWKVETSAGVVEETKALGDVQMLRFIDWVFYAYPQIDYTDPENPVPKPRTPATEGAAVKDWMAANWLGTKANVETWEKREAAQAAVDEVPPLD